MNEKTQKILYYLSEIGKYVVELENRVSEFLPKERDTVEKILDGIFDSKTVPPLRNNAALQSHKKNIQNRQIWTEKEKELMPYLKDLKYRITQDGIHQFRYRRDGFNVSFNSKNFATAKKKAYDFILSIKRELKIQADSIHGRTLEYIIFAWLEIKKNHSDIATYKNYLNIYKLHIAPTFGSRSIKNILPIDLQPFFDELFKEHPRTCEDVRTILNGAFNYAVANRLCPTNPMAAVIIEKHIRVKGSALDPEKTRLFIRTMISDGSKFAIAYLIILFTGIRGAELQSLTFSWNVGTFTVKNAKLKKSQRLNENNIYRTVPIFPDLYTLRPEIEKFGNSLLMASNTMTNNISNFWQGNTVKDLRHTFITRARECGIENELVNLWTGHLPGKNVSANIYTHFSIEYQKREAQKLKFL